MDEGTKKLYASNERLVVINDNTIIVNGSVEMYMLCEGSNHKSSYKLDGSKSTYTLFLELLKTRIDPKRIKRCFL